MHPALCPAEGPEESMGGFIDSILHVDALVAYLLVFALVFAEDAIFVGFIFPGETAAVLGGVVASRGNADLWVMLAVAVIAAIVGDSVGYEVGRKFGPALMNLRPMRRKRRQLDRARSILRQRGGWAVFLGRFTAFLRAVTPALAGISRMPYRTFLAYNAVGGFVWGAAFVLIGYFAGNSWDAVARTVGQDTAVAALVIVAGAALVWRFRRRKEEQGRSAAREHD